MIRKISVKKKTKLNKAKEAGYPQLKNFCETCRRVNVVLTPSHLVKKNSVHKSWTYDEHETDNYFTQCLSCHRAYELLPVRQFDGLTTTRQDQLRAWGMWERAARVDRLISEK